MVVILSNIVAIPVAEVTPELYNAFLVFSVHEDPDWVVRRSKGFPAKQEDRYFFSFSTTADGKYYTFWRGLAGQIFETLNKFGISYEIDDRRVSFSDFNVLMKWDKSLFKFQDKAIADLCCGEDGILVADCGSGKTVMGAAVIATVRQPTLIVVTTIDIQKQWIDSINSFTDYRRGKIGVIGGGKSSLKPITVSTFQSLCKLDKAEWEQVNKMFGCLIVDECHHAPTNSMVTISNKSKALYRYGFTATPYRKDRKEFMMYDCLGHRTVQIPSSELEEEGRKMVPSVQFVPMVTKLDVPQIKRWNGKGVIYETDWTGLYGILAKHEARNSAIVESIISSIKAGHKCLILSNRVEHCKLLYHSVAARGYSCDLVLGGTDRSERANALKNARAGNIDALFATTKLAAEGLDVPIFSCVHLVMPTSNKVMLKQMIGRVCRVKEGKTALAYDYVDIDCDILFAMHNGRRNFYKSEGYVLINHLKN